MVSKKRHPLYLVALIAALLLTAAACGSDSDPGSTTSDAPIVDDGGGLPLADGEPPDVPFAEGACLPDEPECEDTLVEEPDVRDLPDAPTEDPNKEPAGTAADSGMTASGGLTIPEALATDASGTIAIRGHLFDDGGGLQLCESLIGLGERYGCDGQRISVTDLDAKQVPEIVLFEGTTYTEEQITLFGELIDRTLVVDQLVAG